MVHMPRLLYRVGLQKRTVKYNRHRVISVEDRVQAVQLVCHRRGKHSVVDIVVDWLWKIVVLRRILDLDVTQPLC